MMSKIPANPSGLVRRSVTNLEQPFHTDGGWLWMPPSAIGLFCLQPAQQGGLVGSSACARCITSYGAVILTCWRGSIARFGGTARPNMPRTTCVSVVIRCTSTTATR